MPEPAGGLDRATCHLGKDYDRLDRQTSIIPVSSDEQCPLIGVIYP